MSANIIGWNEIHGISAVLFENHVLQWNIQKRWPVSMQAWKYGFWKTKTLEKNVMNFVGKLWKLENKGHVDPCKNWNKSLGTSRNEVVCAWPWALGEVEVKCKSNILPPIIISLFSKNIVARAGERLGLEPPAWTLRLRSWNCCWSTLNRPTQQMEPNPTNMLGILNPFADPQSFFGPFRTRKPST